MARLLLLLLLASSMAQPPGGQVDPARAARNYQAVAGGRVRLEALSAFERAEVTALDRQLRRRRLETAPSAERCRARASTGTPRTMLDERIIALRCD